MKKIPYRVPIQKWNDPNKPMVQTPFFKFIMRNKEQCKDLISAIEAYFPDFKRGRHYLHKVSTYRYIFDHFWFLEYRGLNEQYVETHLN